MCVWFVSFNGLSFTYEVFIAEIGFICKSFIMIFIFNVQLGIIFLSILFFIICP